MEADTVVLMITIVGLNITTTLATIGLLMGQMNRLEDRLSTKFDVMGRDVTDTRERVARIEGRLMASGGFTPRRSRPPAADQPPPEDPAPDQRQAS